MTSTLAAGPASPGLIAPHGGVLVDLRVPAEQRDAIKAGVDHVIECSDRNACDVELLMVGGFSPLRGFMHQEDYLSVVASHRTSSGLLFGLPIVMDTQRDDVLVGQRLLLTYKGQDLAVMTVESRWEPDKAREALGCYGTTSLEHPAVKMIATERGRVYLGGPIEGLELPSRVFPCKSPAEVRATLPAGQDVVAFQCRNPIHRAHYELFTRALEATNVSDQGVVLVHPTCGPTQDDDIAGAVRFQTYERLAAEVNNPARTTAAPTSSLAATWPAARAPSPATTSTAPTRRRISPATKPPSWAWKPCPRSTSSTPRRRVTSPPNTPRPGGCTCASSAAPSSARCCAAARRSRNGLPSVAWWRFCALPEGQGPGKRQEMPGAV